MKKEKRSAGWLPPSPKKRGKHKSYSNSKENSPSSVKNVGSKQEESEHRSNISLYDSVYTCPLSVYIDVTCDDRLLKRLIIQGSPTTQQLEEARFKLISDFGELSNQGEAAAFSQILSNYYYQRSLLVGYGLCVNLILAGKFENAVEFLSKNGLPCSAPHNEDELNKLINRVRMQIKNRKVKFKEAESAYRAIAGKSEKPDRKYYNKLLVMLSTSEVIKIQLNPAQMTVAEFAGYLNLFSEYQNQLKLRKNAKY